MGLPEDKQGATIPEKYILPNDGAHKNDVKKA